jgi:hypothetical protein
MSKSGVPMLAPWISSVVLPSFPPGASSGSLEVTEARTTLADGSHASVAFTTLWMGYIA